MCSLYLNRPPQCWHWSPTQPGKHTQLPVAVLHCPFIQGLSHSFASVKPGSPESSPITESRSAVVSIRRLRPRPEPEQARRVAPYILSQKMAAWGSRSAASGTATQRAARWRGSVYRTWGAVSLEVTFRDFVQAGLRWLLGLHLSSGSVSQRRTEPHIDIQKWRYGNGNAQPRGGRSAQGFKLLFWNSRNPAPLQASLLASFSRIFSS